MLSQGVTSSGPPVLRADPDQSKAFVVSPFASASSFTTSFITTTSLHFPPLLLLHHHVRRSHCHPKRPPLPPRLPGELQQHPPVKFEHPLTYQASRGYAADVTSAYAGKKDASVSA